MRRLVVAAVVAILIVSCMCASAEPIKLGCKFKAGDKDTYKMSMTMSTRMPGIPGMSDQPITTTNTSKISSKVLGVLPDGSARIKYFITGTRTPLLAGLMPGVSKKPEAIKPVTLTVLMSPDGKALSIEGAEGMPVIAGMSASGFMSQVGLVDMLPTEPVSVGDSWVTRNPIPNTDQSIEMRSMLESDNCLVGKTRAAKITQTYAGSLDLAKMMQSGMGAGVGMSNPQARAVMQSSTGTMELTGDACSYIEVSTGKLLKSEGYTSTSMIIQLPPELAAQIAAQGGPTSFTMKMGMQMTVTKL